MRKWRLSILVALTIGLMAWIPGGVRIKRTPGATREMASPGTAAVPTAESATLAGRATFQGTVPKAISIRMEADRNCVSQHQDPVYLQQVEVNEQGGLRNVFVWVKQGLESQTFQPPSTPVVLDQRGCIYVPRVLGIQTGQKLKVLNSDPAMHNVHPLPRQNQEFNLSQPPNGLPLVKTFEHPEVMVRVMCNIHPWMRAYVAVVPHPYFAVTATDGSFEIRDLPPGEYTLAAWHETLGRQEQKVTVGVNETKAVRFVFSP